MKGSVGSGWDWLPEQSESLGGKPDDLGIKPVGWLIVLLRRQCLRFDTGTVVRGSVSIPGSRVKGNGNSL